MKRTKETKIFIKRMLACVMAVVMVLTIAPLSGFVGLELGLSASAVSGQCGDNVYWTLDDNGTLTISGIGAMWNYDYFDFNSENPFRRYSGIIEVVVIKSGVTTIGNYAFKDCIFESITIEDSVITIGDYAFANCYNLRTVTIPNSVIYIGICAFEDCDGLESISIPDSVTAIGEGAFQWCYNLENITIGDNVTTIGWRAFEDTALYNNEDNWENGILYIGKYLIEVTGEISGDYAIKDETKLIADLAFFVLDNLESVTIPDSVTSVGRLAFYNCHNLKRVTIGKGVTFIDEMAFGYYLVPDRFEDYFAKTEDFTIYGYTGTDAERYANENEFIFVPLNQTHTHSYITAVTIPATCTATGVKTYTCSKCGDTYTETIAKIAHTPVTDKVVAATCTTAGKTEGSHCSVCGTVIKAQTTVKATGHTFSAWKTTKAATYTATGTQTRTCSKCKTTETKSIAKLKTTAISKATSSVTASIAYTGKALTPTITVKDGKTTLKQGTHYTVKYTNNKNIGKATVTITGIEKNGYSGTKTLTFKIVPAKVTSLKAKSQTTKSITLSWKKVSGATGYVVYKYDSSKKAYVKVKTTKETTYKVTDLKAGTTYKFKVRAYKKVDGSNVYGAYSAVLSTATKTAAPKITVTAGSKKATLNWKKISGATGYQVYMATSKDGKYKKVGTVKKASTVKYTQKDLTKGKTYYFKVRAYKKVDGKNIYSAYSKVAKVKVK